ncbi:MAG: PAS-domain containing protein [Pseudomonadota bacterium]
MRVQNQNSLAKHTRRELIALLLGSLACAVVLTVSLADQPRPTVAGFQTSALLLFAGLTGLSFGAFGLVLWISVRSRRVVRSAQEETNRLRQSLLTAEAIFKAEPQVLLFWDQVDGLRIVTHTLDAVRGLPQDQGGLLKFGAWLDDVSAADLKDGLDHLFAEGRPFTLYLKLRSGAHLEADGRATGTRAVLRLRDVAGTKRDLARILDQHRRLSGDLRATRALLNALPISAWLADESGRIKWANTAYIEAVEAEDGSEVYDKQIELLESRQRQRIERVLERGQVFSGRLPVIAGGTRSAHDVFVVSADKAAAAAAIDAGALESVQGELDRQVLAFDRTLDRVATPVAIFGQDQNLSFYNQAYQELWKLDPSWLDKSPSDAEILDRLKELSLLPAMADYRSWKTKLLAVYKSTNEFEDWWQLPDGRMLHVVANQRPDGGVTYVYEDISERLALESRYNALIDVQRETLDSLKEGVAVFATDGRLKLFNSALMSIWKLSRQAMEQGPHIDEVVGQARVLFDDGEVWQSLKERVTAITYDRASLSGQMARADATVVDFATTPLPDGGTLVTFVDVTASRAYERALVERNEALEAADGLKSQFIGHVSYELRTPLTNIIGFSELLGSAHVGQLNDKQAEYLADISESSRTLLSIIDDILDLATIDAGGLELKLTPIKIQPVIEAAVLGVRERAGRLRLTLEISLADDVDEIVADESRIRQLLFNLLSNAVGFSKPEGTVRLSAWREEHYVNFLIEDDGVGIPYDAQKRVFDRFESDSHGSRHRGAGLGLSIAKSLVDLHNGDIQLESEPGAGTRVLVRVPERLQASAVGETVPQLADIS